MGIAIPGGCFEPVDADGSVITESNVTDDSVVCDVQSYIAEITGLNQVAFHIEVIDEIPKNDSGKTRYVELEKYYK